MIYKAKIDFRTGNYHTSDINITQDLIINAQDIDDLLKIIADIKIIKSLDFRSIALNQYTVNRVLSRHIKEIIEIGELYQPTANGT